MHNLSLFLFHRDLRLDDNTGLLSALTNSKQVIPCFIFDKKQVENNEYKSEKSIRFMIESLIELKNNLKEKNSDLYTFYGNTSEILSDLIKNNNIDAIYCNSDYTPFAINRDEQIKMICNKNNVSFNLFHDYLLTPPDIIKNKSFKPYSKFTPYYNFARTIEVSKPQINKFSNYYSGKIKTFDFENFFKNLDKSVILGGRKKASQILNKISEYYNYDKTKDYPSLVTTLLSAHNKFGTCSVREVYYKIKDNLGDNHSLIRQLYWRDFFTYVGYHNPFVLGKSFHEKYGKLKWSNDKLNFQKWKDGKTGFPIVDAGMRELNQTGFMHNRVRMIVASFLVKDLHIDWKLGEKYFATKLVDYDPLVNNGNWQWVASTGCDSQPYFRIFNPWRQQQKFDNDCLYIKKYIPELREYTPKQIHNLFKQSVDNYPKPIVNHQIQADIAKASYRLI